MFAKRCLECVYCQPRRRTAQFQIDRIGEVTARRIGRFEDFLTESAHDSLGVSLVELNQFRERTGEAYGCFAVCCQVLEVKPSYEDANSLHDLLVR